MPSTKNNHQPEIARSTQSSTARASSTSITKANQPVFPLVVSRNSDPSRRCSPSMKPASDALASIVFDRLSLSSSSSTNAPHHSCDNAPESLSTHPHHLSSDSLSEGYLPDGDFTSDEESSCFSSRSNSKSNFFRIEESEDCLSTSGLMILPVKKRVGFGHIETRHYSVVIGDHPCCTTGCPLSLGWEYTTSTSSDPNNPDSTTAPLLLSLDQYEATRGPRRSREALRTTWEERRDILSADGVSDGELRRAQRKLHRARSCSAKLFERMSDSFFNDEKGCTAARTPMNEAKQDSHSSDDSNEECIFKENQSAMKE